MSISIYLSIYLSICLSIYLFIYLSIYLSIYISIYHNNDANDYDNNNSNDNDNNLDTRNTSNHTRQTCSFANHIFGFRQTCMALLYLLKLLPEPVQASINTNNQEQVYNINRTLNTTNCICCCVEQTNSKHKHGAGELGTAPRGHRVAAPAAAGPAGHKNTNSKNNNITTNTLNTINNTYSESNKQAGPAGHGSAEQLHHRCHRRPRGRSEEAPEDTRLPEVRAALPGSYGL